MLTATPKLPLLRSYSFIQEGHKVGEFLIPWMGRWSRDGRVTLQMMDQTYSVNPPTFFVSGLGQANCNMELFDGEKSLATIDFPAANNSATFFLLFDDRKLKVEQTGIGRHSI